MDDDSADFEKFMRQRDEAAAAYVNGDTGPVEALTTEQDPVTFFGPGGDVVSGAGPVRAAFGAAKDAFTTGSTSTLEVLQSGASGELAFWCGVQHATVQLQGKDEPVPMPLRITEVFRREGSDWKLIHRQADPFQEGSD